MPRRSVAPGRIFGRFKVLGFSHRDERSSKFWNCLCICGVERTVEEYSLASGHTRSCGCLHREIVSKRGKTHGESGTLEYFVWSSMKARCTNPSSHKWYLYGARGITVCEEWLLSFEAFIRDVGKRPSAKHQIERIDNDGNYEPGNVKWSTRKEQQRNRRACHMVMIDGVSRCLTEWTEILGIKMATVTWRIRQGWSEERALLTPVARKVAVVQ